VDETGRFFITETSVGYDAAFVSDLRV
jgi:hypothetical protein